MTQSSDTVTTFFPRKKRGLRDGNESAINGSKEHTGHIPDFIAEHEHEKE